ncbi:MAG: hypothetical protein NTW62_01530 [Candidatus Nomurabacteria bacterium]|nr:hypothetical protein [Candidatus Nomurabacteria bacterium]
MKNIKKEDTSVIIERIKKSLLDQKAKSAKFGFDIGTHWKDMNAFDEQGKYVYKNPAKTKSFLDKIAGVVVKTLNTKDLTKEKIHKLD